jgi:hypothetical protein
MTAAPATGRSSRSTTWKIAAWTTRLHASTMRVAYWTGEMAGMLAGKACGLVLGLLLAGCAARRPAPTPVTGFHFLADPRAVLSRPGPGVELVEPRPVHELPLPDYPADALAADAGDAHVVLRIVIDEDGRIAEVADSPLASSSDGPFAGPFRDAVLRSLRHWRFTAGSLQTAEGGDLDGDGEPDYRRVLRSEPVSVYYDVRFEFEIVDGRGRVRSTAPTGAD